MTNKFNTLVCEKQIMPNSNNISIEGISNNLSYEMIIIRMHEQSE